MDIREVKREITSRMVTATIDLEVDGKPFAITVTQGYDTYDTENDWMPSSTVDTQVYYTLNNDQKDELSDWVRERVTL